MLLTSLDLSSFNFSSLVNVVAMFHNCYSLKYLALPNYMPLINDTSKMFEYCVHLTYLNLSFLQSATKLKTVYGMFLDCYRLSEIVFPEVKARELERANAMFQGCTHIKSINLEGLNTNSIKDIDSMFEECKNLEYLNIKNLDTRNTKNVENIFKNISKKITIIYNPRITGPELRREIMKVTLDKK